MDEPLHDVIGEEPAENAGGAGGAEGLGSIDEAAVESASAEYLGRWNRLVSTTNWEKGRIICQWRQELLSAGAPLEAAGDEAWSRRVGNVSPQHVGRLRRVFQRFGEIHAQFDGLYWSHFQAALDWHDAEMWLEGAVQSSWSVARMRTERWQAMGAPPGELPREEDVVTAEPDEDTEASHDSATDTFGPSLREVHPPEEDGREEHAAAEDEAISADDEAVPFDVPADNTPVRPFEDLPQLPRDLADAFETFKLAILNHKLAGWRDISADGVLSALNALKELAIAPS